MLKFRLGTLILRNLQGQLPGKETENLITFATTAFSTLDVDKSGRLTKQQFLTAIREMGFGLTLSQEYQLMEVIDSNHNNSVEISGAFVACPYSTTHPCVGSRVVGFPACLVLACRRSRVWMVCVDGTRQRRAHLP